MVIMEHGIPAWFFTVPEPLYVTLYGLMLNKMLWLKALVIYNMCFYRTYSVALNM